ncbi:MAG: PQQ-binding-like beta-propeller repeat protein [Halorientalis sp.]
MPTTDRRTLLKAAGLAAGGGVLDLSVEPVSGATGGAVWPQIQHDAGNTGFSGGLTTPTLVQEAWSYTTPDEYDDFWDETNHFEIVGSPVIDSDTVYILSNRATVRAFDLDGNQQWSTHVGYGDTDGGLALAGDTLIVANDKLVALDTADGSELWSETDQVGSGPTVVDDTVYVMSGDGMIARAVDDGSKRWLVSKNSTQAPAVVDGTLVGSDDNDDVFALDAATGDQLWTYDTSDFGQIGNSPTIADGTVYLATAVGTGEQGSVRALDLDDGSEQWVAMQSSQQYGSVAVADGTVFTIDNLGRQLTALDADTGDQLWTGSVPYAAHGGPVVANGVVYAKGANTVKGFDAETGTELFSQSVDGESDEINTENTINYASPLALAHNAVYVANGNTLTKLVGLTPDWPQVQLDAGNTGYGIRHEAPRSVSEAWHYATPDEYDDFWDETNHFEIVGSPVIDSDTVYILSNRATVRAFDLDGNQQWSTHVGYGDTDGGLALAGDTLIVANDKLVALDTADGSELWSETDQVGSGPTVVDDTVYVMSGDGMIARAVDDGSKRWLVSKNSTQAPAVVDGTLVGSDDNDDVFALDAATGDQLWTYDTSDFGQIGNSPTIADGTVYLATAVGTGEQGSVRALDLDDGSEQWVAMQSSQQYGSVAVADGTVFTIDNLGRQLTALDADTGDQLWTGGIDYAAHGGPVVADGSVYVLGGETVRGFDAESGTELFRHGVSGDSDEVQTSGTINYSSSIAIYDGALYVAYKNTLYKLD